MTSSKTFQQRSAARSSEETDRVLPVGRAESIVVGEPESIEWPYAPQLSRDEALWQHPTNREPRTHMLLGLQQQVGNQAVQRLVSQQRSAGAFEVDDETQARIHRECGGSQILDPMTRASMGRSIGYDFSGVRIHTSAEADELSHDLKALAFTIGHDIFFRAGEYDPSSLQGQELLAHELAHVVQQSSGSMGAADRMTVNASGDANEQAADAIARSTVSNRAVHDSSQARASVQREAVPEEEELQLKAEPGAWIQRQEEEREPVAPVPEVSGQGEVFQDVAFARALPNLQGRTNATFRNSFRTEGMTTEAGEGCRGCRPRDCVHVAGSLVSEFTVTTRVTLPRVPRGFSPCEREQIQNAIDTTLADHEQQHVAAFETYNGTENTPIDLTMCRGQVNGAIRRMHTAIERPRRADARAASAALDPFTFDYTVEPCEDEPAGH